MRSFGWATIVMSIVIVPNVALAAAPAAPSVSEDQVMSAGSHTQTGLIQYCVSKGLAEASAVNADRERALASDQQWGYEIDAADIPKFEAIGAQGFNFTLDGKVILLADYITAGNTWSSVKDWCFENTNR